MWCISTKWLYIYIQYYSVIYTRTNTHTCAHTPHAHIQIAHTHTPVCGEEKSEEWVHVICKHAVHAHTLTLTLTYTHTHTHDAYIYSEVEREEWVHVIRKHAVNSVIDNGYEIRRDDKDSKLGSGKHIHIFVCTWWQCTSCMHILCVCVCFLWYDVYTYICIHIHTHADNKGTKFGAGNRNFPDRQTEHTYV